MLGFSRSHIVKSAAVLRKNPGFNPVVVFDRSFSVISETRKSQFTNKKIPSRFQKVNNSTSNPVPKQFTNNNLNNHNLPRFRVSAVKKDGYFNGVSSEEALELTTPHTSNIYADYILPPEDQQYPVATLSPALLEVLKHDGPVTLGKMDDSLPFIDPAAFDGKIVLPEATNWNSIPAFITSSRDTTLTDLAIKKSCEFIGSTSSVSSILSQLHFSITDYNLIQNTEKFSNWFENAPTSHTRSTCKPASNILRRREGGVWGIDQFPSGEPKQNQILIDLGKSLERHLTYDNDEYKRIFVLEKGEDGKYIRNDEVASEVPSDEAHRFVQFNRLLLRSQLDCEEPTVRNGKKVFDLKTRAVLPIRLDVGNHHLYNDYHINRATGLYNSFEREYFDMTRSAFLKYSFQCRIGDMGGIFVAYHNTSHMFGFEYISLQDMDSHLYGDSVKADFIYKHSVTMMQDIISKIIKDNYTSDLERESIRITTCSSSGKLTVFVETYEQIDCDNVEVLENALSCPYTGVVYIDRLTYDQVKAALERRDMDTTGSLGTLMSRLESVVAVPDVAFVPRSEQETMKLVNEGRIKAYVVELGIYDDDANRYHFKHLQQPDDLHIKYSISNITDSVSDTYLNRAYTNALADYSIRDAHKFNAEVPKEDYTTVEINGKEVSLHPLLLENRSDVKRKMLELMNLSKDFDEYHAMNDSVEKDSLRKTLVDSANPARKNNRNRNQKSVKTPVTPPPNPSTPFKNSKNLDQESIEDLLKNIK